MELFIFVMSYVGSFVIVAIIAIISGSFYAKATTNLTPKRFIIFIQFLGSLLISTALTIAYYWGISQDFFFYGTILIFILGIVTKIYYNDNNKIAIFINYIIYLIILHYFIPFVYNENGSIVLFYVANFISMSISYDIIGYIFPNYKKDYEEEIEEDFKKV